jgi:hypothetical protein
MHLHSFWLSQIMFSISVESFTDRSDRRLKLDSSICSWYCPIYSRNDTIREVSLVCLLSVALLTTWMMTISQTTHVLVIYQTYIDEIP